MGKGSKRRQTPEESRKDEAWADEEEKEEEGEPQSFNINSQPNGRKPYETILFGFMH